MPSRLVVMDPENRPFSQVSAVPGTTLLIAGQIALARTSSGSVVVRAPASPSFPQSFAVVDLDGSAASTPITIEGNGTLIDGSVSITFAIALGAAVFVFDGEQWRRVATRRAFDASGAPIELAVDATGSSGGSGVVDNLRGRTILATTPTDSQTLSLNSTNAWQPVLRSVHVELFGAVADADGSLQSAGIATGTDNAPFIEAAIRSLHPTQGGRVDFGFGGYRVSRPIIADRPIILCGQSEGATAVPSGTTIFCDWRTTGIRIGQGVNGMTSTGNDDSGQGSNIRHIQFRAVARDSAITYGNWAYATYSASMPDADAARFSLGQLISIGAANQEFTLQRVYAATGAGSPIVTITGSDPGSSRGIYVGQYLIVGTAFPQPTRVEAIAQFAGYVTVTMASNAATTLSASIVKERPHLLARILSKSSAAGITTLVTDMQNGAITADLVGVAIRDASAAIDMRFTAKIAHVVAHSFEGPGVAILTNGLTGQNNNAWRIDDLTTHSCRNAVVAHGQNSQTGTATGVYSIQSREWAVVEDTQAGNTWIGVHADGGYATLVRDGCSAALLGAYCEVGTYASFSTLTHSVGGTGSFDSGGVSDVGGIRNFLTVGDRSTNTHQFVCDPNQAYFELRSPGVAAGLQLRRSSVAQDGAAGYVLLSHSNATRRLPLAFTDDDGPAGIGKGELLLPGGFRIGGTAVNLPDAANSPFFYVCDEEPTSEIFDEFTAGVKWRNGDGLLISGRGSESAAFLRCTRTGNAAPLWAPLANVAAGSRMRLNADDGYFYTADNTAVTGAAEPAGGATIVGDGSVNWTRQGASALFERIGEAAGYRVRPITGSETWATTDAHFRAGSVEVTGALGANATLTLPKQRYSRWLWNRTTGGFSLLVKCSTGNTVTIAPGMAAFVQCTGVEMRRGSADVTP